MKLKVQGSMYDKDLGMKNLLKLMNVLKNPRSLEVGLVDASPGVMQRAHINEFGLGVTPRPWLTTATDVDGPKWMAAWEKEFWRIYRNPQTGETAEHLNAFLGKIAVGSMKEWLVNGPWEGNKQSTIEKKGFDHPLIETGEMLASIKYKLYKPGELK
jgi:hypothetical protein